MTRPYSLIKTVDLRELEELDQRLEGNNGFSRSGVLRMAILVSMLVLILARYQLVEDDNGAYNVVSNSNDEANDHMVVPNWGYRNSKYCLTKCVFECLVTFWQIDCYPACVLKCKVMPLPPPASPKAPHHQLLD